jgi:hypothetical protein
MTDEKENMSDYPPREKTVINMADVETPERPKVIDEYARPDEIPQEVWDAFTPEQKQSHAAVFKANKIHALRHGGNKR